MKVKIKDYYAQKAEAARIRSKVNWYEKGEKSTGYFFKLEKKRGAEKLWTRIKGSDGRYKDDIESILEEQVSFYKQLFTSEGWDRDAAENLLQNIDHKLSEENKKICEMEISLDEISKAVKILKLDKSPGEDGIVNEFYKTYWYLISDDFGAVIKEIFDNNLLCESQYRGMITLMFKSGEREDIKNWRPITLLNTDYKIISKVLAERLKNVLPQIIDFDQKGFVKGRNIFQGNRLLQDVIDFCELEDEEGAILFLDQQKAFDRAEWEWIDFCLLKFGFGEKFRSWVKMLFINAKTCIHTNGFTSRFVGITRSIRQGCPIAPMLYILQAEPLAASIRNNPNIKGIKLPTRTGDFIETKLNMFADDTQLFNKSEESIEETFKTLKLYENASGAKMNMDKTVGMYLGKWRNKKPKFNKIKWSKRPVKALGVLHGYGVDLDQIWLEKINKIKSCMEVWKSRDLTFTGKVLIIKSFVLSVIGYEIEMRGIPDIYEKQINNIIWSFIWDGKTNQIARTVCCLPKEKGGIGMINLRDFIKSKQVKSMYSIVNSKTQKWNAIGKYWLTSLDEKYDTDFFICSCSDTTCFKQIQMSKYYKELLISWTDLQKIQKSVTKEDLLEENIFGNCKLKFKGHALYYANFASSGIKKIKDIWDLNNKSFKTSLDIFNSLKDKRNWIAQYSRIKSSLTPQQIDVLKTDSSIHSHSDGPIKIINSCQFIKNGVVVDAKKLCLKDIRYFYENKTAPNSQLKWNLHFGNELPWDYIWETLNKNLANRKIKQFQWKLLHNIIYTEEKLQKMNRSNGKCHFCNEKESLFHLFIYCKLVEDVWREIFEKIREFCSKLNIQKLQKSETSIIFGVINADASYTQILDTVLLITKWVIWKTRNIAKYQKKGISKLVILNMIKHEMQFLLKYFKPNTKIEAFSTMCDIFCI